MPTLQIATQTSSEGVPSMTMHPMADLLVLPLYTFFQHINAPYTPHAAPSWAAQHAQWHTWLLMSPLITMTYLQSVTPLSMLWILTQHHHPTSFSQLAITIPATITAMQSATVHPSPNVPKDIEASNQIWSHCPHACVFDCFRCVVILAHLCLWINTLEPFCFNSMLVHMLLPAVAGQLHTSLIKRWQTTCA